MLLTHPEIPTCADCQKWMLNPANGWKCDKRVGKDLARPIGTPLPCANPTACPKSNDGLPHPEKDMTGSDWRAYMRYLEIKGGAKCPDDPAMERLCGVFRFAEDIAQQARENRSADFAPLLVAALSRKQ